MVGTPVKASAPPSLGVGSLPILEGAGVFQWAQNRFNQLQATIGSLVAMAVGNAKALPKSPQDGMLKLARYPWWPVSGQSGDAWVYYDASGAAWRYLGTSPTSTH